MDVMTMRFIVIFLIIVIGMILIPVGFFFFCHIRYPDGKMRLWMLPVIILYFYLFINYCNRLIPERWSLEPVQVYQCEWKTNYIPKYPIKG